MGAANRAGSDIPTPPLSTKSAGRHELHAAAPGSEDLLLLYHFLLEGIVTWLMEMAILKAPFDLLTSKRPLMMRMAARVKNLLLLPLLMCKLV